jgi:hypothetical protein
LINVNMLIETAQLYVGPELYASSSYGEGLRKLVEIINGVRFSDREEIALEEMLISLLCRRLSVETYVHAHPHVHDQTIERPVFIVGLPRTGSTLLHQLLARDARRRTLRNWQAYHPVPPLSTRELLGNRQVLMHRRRQEIALKYRPSLARAHWEFVDDPTECHEVLAQDFRVAMVGLSLRVPGLSEVSLGADATSSYTYHRTVVRMLQMSDRASWLFKSPLHSPHLPALLKIYPDARLIWTHRDPYRVAASYSSLRAQLTEQFGPAESKTPNGASAQVSKELQMMLTGLLGTDEGVGRGRFYHIHYAQLMRDPLRQIAKLYDWLGEEMTSEASARMKTWLASNPQYKYGKHAYSFSQAGLSEHALGPVFPEYCERYQVEREVTS